MPPSALGCSRRSALAIVLCSINRWKKIHTRLVSSSMALAPVPSAAICREARAVGGLKSSGKCRNAGTWWRELKGGKRLISD